MEYVWLHFKFFSDFPSLDHFYCSKDGGKEELCPLYYTGDFYLRDTQRKPKKEICHNATTSGSLVGEEFGTKMKFLVFLNRFLSVHFREDNSIKMKSV